MVNPVVLDASALIALIYNEKGAAAVERHMQNALISSVNLTEVLSYMVREGIPVHEAYEMIQDLSLHIVDFDAPQGLLAAGMLPKTAAKGLSLGDRACLALAMTRKLPALTADKLWKDVLLDVKIEIIR